MSVLGEFVEGVAAQVSSAASSGSLPELEMVVDAL